MKMNKFGIRYNDNNDLLFDNSIDRYYVSSKFIIMSRIIDSTVYPLIRVGIKLLKRLKR